MKLLRDNTGAALILAVMAMVIMTTIIVEFAYNTRVDISMLSNYRNAQQGRYFAEVGIEAAKVLLLSDLERDASAGREIDFYAFDPSRETESGDSPLGGALAGLAGMGGQGQGDLAAAAGGLGGELEEVWSLMTPELPPIPLADTGAMIHLEITDEAGKVNLNQLDVPRGFTPEDKRAKRWIHFFTACGLDESQAAELIPVLLDWIDRDDESTTNGAESQLYQQFDPPYLPRNGPLFGVEELRLINGIDAEAWGKIAPHVTVFPRAGAVGSKLNVNTASSVALQFLDERLDAEVAQTIIDERNKDPFVSDSKFREVIAAYAADLQQNIVTAGYALRSDVYRVRSSALVNDVEYTVTAVLQRTKGSKDIKVLYWRAE